MESSLQTVGSEKLEVGTESEWLRLTWMYTLDPQSTMRFYGAMTRGPQQASQLTLWSSVGRSMEVTEGTGVISGLIGVLVAAKQEDL